MKNDFIYSALLHFGIVAIIMLSSVFESKAKVNFDEVIKVSLTSIPESMITEVPMIVPPDIPDAIEDDFLDIPIDDPTVMPEQIIPEVKKDKPKKKKDKPKPKKQPVKQEQPEDKTIEASGTDSPFSGATVDNVSFDYPYWFTQAFRKIKSNWRNPVSSDGLIVCTVNFQVIKSGRMVNVRVIESSGIPLFDNACIAAITKSAPFPPLPREFIDEIIGITIPMSN